MADENLEDILKQNTRIFLKSFRSKFGRKSRKKRIGLSFTDDEISNTDYEFSSSGQAYRKTFYKCLEDIDNILQDKKLFESDGGTTPEKEKEFIKFYQDYIVFVAKLYDVNYVPLKDVNSGKRILFKKDGTMAVVKDDVHKYHSIENNTHEELFEEYGFLYRRHNNSVFGLIDERDDMIVKKDDEIKNVVEENWADVLKCDYKAKDQMLLGFLSSMESDFSKCTHIDNTINNDSANSLKIKPYSKAENPQDEELKRILHSLRIVANKGMNFKDDENGQVLKENFIKFYGIKHYPKYAEAHHIAPKKNDFASAKDCRQIVINYLVDINHPCNCVPLPKDKRRADILGTAQHNGPCEELHGKKIMDQLYNDLKKMKSVYPIIKILSKYRLTMLGRKK